MKHQVRATNPLFLLKFFLASIFAISPVMAQAPRPERVRHELLLLDIDVAATKKFATVQNHLRVGQLAEAVELLRNINEGQTGKLVAAAPGRYVNWRTYANMLSAALPPDGLKIYREQFDPLLRPKFEAAHESLDEPGLVKVIEQGYCCSFADEALLLLGDLAWDDGDIWRARSYWEQLLPPLQPKDPGEPVMLLAYPDSDVNRSQVLGRLALCSIQAGRLDSARRIVARLTDSDPNATGHLAGRTGKLREILLELIDQVEKAPVSVRSSSFETFGGHPRRFDRVQQATGFGTLRWQAGLKSFGGEPRRGFIPGGPGDACYFPVVYGDMLLVQDSEHIYAYKLETGEPVWPAEDGSAKIFSAENLNPGALNRGFGDRSLPNIGLPRLTMTVADGRLYARMGPIQPVGGERGGVLVCLDLAHRDGKLMWNSFATEIDPDDTDWNFEGSPLVIGNRLYIGLRKSNPQPQSNVACFDAGSGKLLWSRKICVGSANPNIPDFDINQHLLTWGDGTLYYATHMGAIAALEPTSGAIKWLATYPRVEDPRFRFELEQRLRRGPLPAMFADGTVYVAPLDSDELFAIDAETGVVKWTRAFQTPVQSLLGASNGLVFVSGAQLWAVSAQTGRVVWPQAGDRDPEAAGFGRGLLVGDSIYWPNHEEILVVEQATGMVKRRFPLLAAHRQSGGNLLVVDGFLVIAEPDRIAVFADLPGMRNPPFPGPGSPKKESPVQKAFNLGRIEAAEKNWQLAADQFRWVRDTTTTGDEWNGRPLSVVAAQREFDARLELAKLAVANNESAPEIDHKIDSIMACAPDRVRRGLALALATQWCRESEDERWRGFAQRISDDMTLTKLSLRLAREGPIDLQKWSSQLLNEPAAEKATSQTVVNPVPIATHLDSDLPWPLTRRWSKSFDAQCQFLKPHGQPLNADLSCILADQCPICCLNLQDGSIRWQIRMSSRLQWAEFHQDRLLLATETEIRSVSALDGKTQWWLTLNSSPIREPEAGSLTLLSESPTPSPQHQNLLVQVWDAPTLYARDGLFSDFVVADDLLLARHGSRRIVAWHVSSGEPAWNVDTAQELGPGMVNSEGNVFCSAVSPNAVMLLEVSSGRQNAQWPIDSGTWSRRPTLRDDRSILTVGRSGQIAAWSRPGLAWWTKEGPLAWKWNGNVSQSKLPPQVLSQGEVSLLVLEGDTLIAAKPSTDTVLWKVGLGREIVADARATLSVDDQCVYVPAEGIVHAYALHTGAILWERYVGESDQPWRSQCVGDAIIAYPAQAHSGSNFHLTILDKKSGKIRQRMQFDIPPGSEPLANIEVIPAGKTTLVACRGLIIGLGEP